MIIIPYIIAYALGRRNAQTTAVTSTSFLSISGGTQGKTFYVQRESLELKELCYR